MDNKNTRIILAQNELVNVATRLLQQYELDEQDMYFVMQGVNTQIMNMAVISMAFLDFKKDAYIESIKGETVKDDNKTES